jgi:hypothetical protein
MAQQSDTIHIADDSELAEFLDQAANPRLRLERGSVVYRVVREDDPWVGYDPDKVLAAVQATAGSWADLDTDPIIANLYKAREEGTRPVDRP